MRKFVGMATVALAIVPQMQAQGTVEATLGNVATQAERTIVTQGGPGGMPDDPRYRATYGLFSGVDGVVSLRIVTPEGVFGCTGTLLNNRRQVLTAAHCITNGSNVITASSVDVRFQGTSNTFERTLTAASSALRTHPGYTGQVFADHDLAIIDLPEEAPAFAQGVGIFGGSPAEFLNQTVTFTGYGTTGTGATGDAQSGFAFTRRFGFNRFEASCNGDGCNATNNTSRAQLLADFDNGIQSGQGTTAGPTYNANALCRFFGVSAPAFPNLCNAGVNPLLDEVGIGRGDSGGPALFNGLIVGVASWGARLDGAYAFGGWGTISGHVNVSLASNREWLNQVAPGAVVPEPSTYVLMATGLAALGGIARRRRKAA